MMRISFILGYLSISLYILFTLQILPISSNIPASMQMSNIYTYIYLILFPVLIIFWFLLSLIYLFFKKIIVNKKIFRMLFVLLNSFLAIILFFLILLRILFFI